MPEYFIRILEVFTTNRTTSIILDNGENTAQFNLEIGNAQGNGPSPLQFNFCEQILFFKIELDPRIQSVYSVMDNMPSIVHKRPVKVFDNHERGVFSYESDRETDKLEGFADYGTVLALASPVALRTVKNILDSFQDISGLKCNVNKSVILPVGFNDGILPDYIYQAGFPVVESVTILGAKITKNYAELAENFEEKITKIRNIANFWHRFKLSIQGRILIAKTFMLSQVGYLGCIIRPTQPQLITLSTLISNFIKGPMQIAKDRITTPQVKAG
jgi:hypothetical protein